MTTHNLLPSLSFVPLTMYTSTIVLSLLSAGALAIPTMDSTLEARDSKPNAGSYVDGKWTQLAPSTGTKDVVAYKCVPFTVVTDFVGIKWGFGGCVPHDLHHTHMYWLEILYRKIDSLVPYWNDICGGLAVTAVINAPQGDGGDAKGANTWANVASMREQWFWCAAAIPQRLRKINDSASWGTSSTWSPCFTVTTASVFHCFKAWLVAGVGALMKWSGLPNEHCLYRIFSIYETPCVSA